MIEEAAKILPPSVKAAPHFSRPQGPAQLTATHASAF